MQLHADLVLEKRVQPFAAAIGRKGACRVEQKSAQRGKGGLRVYRPRQAQTKTAHFLFLTRKRHRITSRKIPDAAALGGFEQRGQGPKKRAVAIIPKKEGMSLSLGNQLRHLLASCAKPFARTPRYDGKGAAR